MMPYMLNSLEDRVRYQLGDLQLKLLFEEKDKEDLQEQIEKKDAEIARLRDEKKEPE